MGILEDLAVVSQRRKKRRGTGGRSGSATPSASASIPQSTTATPPQSTAYAQASNASSAAPATLASQWSASYGSTGTRSVYVPEGDPSVNPVFQYMTKDPAPAPKQVSQTIVRRGNSLWLPTDIGKGWPIAVYVKGTFALNGGKIRAGDRVAYFDAITEAITNYTKKSLETDLQQAVRRLAFVTVADTRNAQCAYVSVGGAADEAWVKKDGTGWDHFGYEEVAAARG